MKMDGQTRLLPIIGDPVKQVRAPLVWTGLFSANGVNAVCVPFHVPPSDLAGLVAAMRRVHNLIGLIVTVPHKPAAAILAGRLTPRAARIGVVNVLRPDPDGGWAGDMLDGEGFLRGLRRSGQRLEGRRALLLGAGGVGAAIASSSSRPGSPCCISRIWTRGARQRWRDGWKAPASRLASPIPGLRATTC
ncbi:shikimate dehydrogenase family protein [Pseudoroseomonas wenyumeiae]